MASDASTYVSMPNGLVTASGRWYHIPEEAVREYAGPVLDHVSLDTLVRWAELWLESPRTVTLWAVPPLLWGLPNGWAIGAALGVYLTWMVGSPAMPRIGAVRVVAGLQKIALQGTYYALVLSVLAVTGQLTAVGLGLGAFVLLRWRVVDFFAQWVHSKIHRRLYPLPVNDQVLRALIIRAALKYRVSVPQVDVLTNNILENWGTRTDAASEADDVSSSPSN